MTDPNLIYPGRDLTNVFPEEGSEVVNEPMITVREADNRMLLHGNKVIAGTIERCAQVEVGDKYLQMYNEAMIRAVVADTIERCAQVSVPSQARFNVRSDDAYVDGYWDGRNDMIAAIRALKDKP